LERRYRQLVCLFAHAFVANTDGAYAELVGPLGIEPRNVHRAMLLVPPTRGALAQDSEFKRRPDRRPLFLFVGGLFRRKNVGALVDAAAALRARGFEFELWIVGDGHERAQLERQAIQLVNEGAIRFLGSLPNTAVGAAFETADVFVMPTLHDYRSVAVLEAMRFGKPVIDSANDGNASDFVRHEMTGLVFDPNQPDALTEAMERAVLEPELFREMGRRAAAVMDEHTPQTAAIALRDILDVLKPT
jgi:glycosyltransferase involved in cell wall biosynthesis